MPPPTARSWPASRPSPSPPPANSPAKPSRRPCRPKPRPPKKRGTRPHLYVRTLSLAQRPRRAKRPDRGGGHTPATPLWPLPSLRRQPLVTGRPPRPDRLRQPARPQAPVPGRCQLVLRRRRSAPGRVPRPAHLRPDHPRRLLRGSGPAGRLAAYGPGRRGRLRGDDGGHRVPDRWHDGQHLGGLAGDASGHLCQTPAGPARVGGAVGQAAAAGAARPRLVRRHGKGRAFRAAHPPLGWPPGDPGCSRGLGAGRRGGVALEAGHGSTLGNTS
jgi:hypothetical protein